MKAIVFFAPGFEEIEAITSVDVLRRAGLQVTMAAVGGNGLAVKGSHGVVMQCDALVEELSAAGVDVVVYPGGLPGATNLAASPHTARLAQAVLKQGGRAAAICAAPLALQAAGVLEGHRYTCYPSFEKKIGGDYSGARVQVDGHIITACGPGASAEFALAIVAELGLDSNRLASEMQMQ